MTGRERLGEFNDNRLMGWNEESGTGRLPMAASSWLTELRAPCVSQHLGSRQPGQLLIVLTGWSHLPAICGDVVL